MSRYLLLLLFQVSFLPGILKAQIVTKKDDTKSLIAEIDSILNGKVGTNEIPGAVIQIKKGGQIIYNYAYGYAQKYDFNGHPLDLPEKMTTDHLFDIASLTKVIGTTTSIMLLADRSLIKIDDPVGKYLNGFDTGQKKEITIRHLLTHTAGLYEWYPLYYRSSNKDSTYKLIAGLPLKFPVGKQRRYSDLGFMLLGEIVEKVSGLPLEQFMQQNIFQPLGMNNTMYNPLLKGKTYKIAATSHGNPYEKRMVYDSSLGFQVKGIDPMQWNGWRNYTLKGEVNDGNTWYANVGVSGAAGLFSSVDDLQHLVDMLMNKGRVGSTPFISGWVIDSFFTKDQFNNALGWMMDPTNSFMKDAPAGTFGHTGFTGTSIVVVPQYHLSIILLINRQNTGLSKTGEYYNVNPVRQQVFKSVVKWCQQ